MKGLSPAMHHVIDRCSTVERWDRSGRTFGRQWPYLVAGRSNVSYTTVRALIDRGLLYHDDEGVGLTPEGVRVWIELHGPALAQPSPATSTIGEPL